MTSAMLSPALACIRSDSMVAFQFSELAVPSPTFSHRSPFFSGESAGTEPSVDAAVSVSTAYNASPVTT
ncbi:hypothetical protein D3C76_1463600 [compost metagenome]